MGNLGKQTGTMDTNITNRIEEMRKRILIGEDTVEQIDTPGKENVKSKRKSWHKTFPKPRTHEKSQHNNRRRGGRRRFPTPTDRKYF